MKNNKGFTLVEIVIAIVLMGTLIAVTLSKFNFTTKISDNIGTDFLSSMNTIEASFGNYVNDKNTTPSLGTGNGLDDANFVPTYLMIPPAPTGFDLAYGNNGYLLWHRTGQAAPNNGWCVISRVSVTGASDPKWQALVALATKLPATKFNYNTTAPNTANMATPAGAATVLTTYWLTRY